MVAGEDNPRRTPAVSTIRQELSLAVHRERTARAIATAAKAIRQQAHDTYSKSLSDQDRLLLIAGLNRAYGVAWLALPQTYPRQRLTLGVYALGVLLLHWSKPTERRVLRGRFLEDALDCAGILTCELGALALAHDLKERASRRDEILVDVFADLLDVAPHGLFEDDTKPKEIPLPQATGVVIRPSLEDVTEG